MLSSQYLMMIIHHTVFINQLPSISLMLTFSTSRVKIKQL